MAGAFKKTTKRLMGFFLAATMTGVAVRDKMSEDSLIDRASEAAADELAHASYFFDRYNEQAQAAGDRYDAARTFNRAWRLHTEQTPVYTARSLKKDLLPNCLQADDTLMEAPANTALLWRNIQMMKKSPLIGAPLVQNAIDNDVLFCYGNIDANGQWGPDTGQIDMGNNTARAPNLVLLTTVHEGMHDRQSHTALQDVDFHWSINEFQMHHLATEAAAMATSYVFAIDMINNGHPEMEKTLLESEHEGAPRAALSAYGLSRAKGKSHRDALLDAGQAGFEAQFTVQWWLDAYNSSYLAWHLRATLSYGPNEKLPEATGKPYTLEEMKREAQVSPDFNFLTNLKATPSYATRFGNNERMRHAFDYADYLRQLKIEGPLAPAVKDRHDQLVKAKNPYIKIKDTKHLSDLVIYYMRMGGFDLLDTFDLLAGEGMKPEQKQKPKLPQMK